MSADEKAIRELIERWMQASATGDLATVLDMMSDDVIFMVPGREPFGKEAFAAASEAMRDMRMEGVSNPAEIKILGDWAYMRNHLTVTVTPKSGAPMRRSGYTLTIFNKKPDGAWVISRDANLLTAET